MGEDLHDLGLSVRSAKLATRLGATTVGELARFTADELLSAKCFGETSLKEVREKLAERGLRLGMSADELRGRAGLEAKVVRQERAGEQPANEHEHEGACCGHCEDAARALRERTERERGYNLSLAELE